MKKKPIQISTIGLNERSLHTFEFFFKKDCKARYVLCEEHRIARITLIDIDMAGSDTALNDYRKKNPTKTVICLSVSGESTHGDFCIKKPINSTELVQLLDNIVDKATVEQRNNNCGETIPETELSMNTEPGGDTRTFNQSNTSRAGEHLGQEDESDLFGKNRNIDINNKKEVALVTYSPKNMFQGAIIKGCNLAKSKNSIVEVRCLGVSAIIDGASFKAYTAAPYGVIRPTCLLRSSENPQFKNIEFENLEETLLSHNRGKKTNIVCMDIDAFIWKISLWSSRGRIPEGTNFSLPVYLIHWPNLTRLDNIPHAPRIASVLMSAPDTLCHIAERLDIPQRYVFGFYSACNALELSGNARRQVDNLFKPTERPLTHPRVMLRKILDHVRKTTQKDSPASKKYDAQ
ncbi:MAG: hypothetical protein KUG53_02270 [Pseudomonadales bacterium]|nr:hypothetical protein [Pseudomonadales bacterium]